MDQLLMLPSWDPELLLAIVLAIITAFLYYPSKQVSSFYAGNAKTVAQSSSTAAGGSRDIAAALKKSGKKIVFFYGSQTGTAEQYANRLAKDVKAHYGLSSLVCDPQEYDFNVLDRIPSDALVVFIVATYGEGDPTDNAIGLLDFLKADTLDLSNGGNSLSNLHYAVFGLGNRTYEHFCAVGRCIDERLAHFGATRVGTRGEGDDDNVLEEDYLAWKDSMWNAVEKTFGWQDGAGTVVPDFYVLELQKKSDTKDVYLGELCQRALTGVRGVHDARNPYISPIFKTKELFQDGDRNCIFAEFDISSSGLKYQTGDHVGIWPMNPEREVECLLRILGLEPKRNAAIDVQSLDLTLAKVPFPVPTTYECALRYYLDISQQASRQIIHSLAKYAPTSQARSAVEKFGTDKEYYLSAVAQNGLTLSQVLITAAGDPLNADPTLHTTKYTEWPIPFAYIISSIPRLQPRYYSISSSPRLFPNSIHITAIVVKQKLHRTASNHFYGLATNYLLNLKNASLAKDITSNEKTPKDESAPVHKLEGPRGKYKSSMIYSVPVHTRVSTFRLPTSVKIPIVMIGPGTGVAPFRAFVQDRVALARRAKARHGPAALADWGDMHLFYSCRRADHDFLYKDEWSLYAAELDGKLKLHVGFSREAGQKKIYVQNLLEQEREDVAEVLGKKKRGYVYICGDAKGMAKDVESTLGKILAGAKGKEGDNGVGEVKGLKDQKRMILDVW
ncbi:MAG: NADPH-cytochrome P450 reductase [Cirrosporium novae-zelandiae]|nr:MAG: NADPH-cytochrome P450 reductase [Cirrosporium novae-zelandiae]